MFVEAEWQEDDRPIPKQDVASVQADKDKTDRNKQWLKRVSSDIYIGETIKVMDNMIGQAALAKAK